MKFFIRAVLFSLTVFFLAQQVFAIDIYNGSVKKGIITSSGNIMTFDALTNNFGFLNGRVGIGALTAPAAYKLYTVGAAGVTGLLNVSGNVTVAGTVTFPALTNGVLSVNGSGVLSAGAIGVSSGGTGTTTVFTPGSVVFAGASGVYSQNNNNFFWDNSNTRLGIGKSNPAVALDVNGNIAASALLVNGATQYYRDTNAGSDITQQMGMRGSNTGAGSGRFGIDFNTGGSDTGLNFGVINSGGVNNIRYASILAGADATTAGSESGHIAFFTKPTGSSLSERMRLDPNGRLGIGKTNPGTSLDVNGTITGTGLTISGLSNGYIPVAGSGGAFGNSVMYQNGSTIAIGGTDSRGILTVQSSHNQLFGANTDPQDAGRTFVMQNNSQTNAANQYANITLQINAFGGLGTGRVLGDLRLVRETLNQTNAFFMLSAFRQDGTYKDYAKVGYDTSYFVGNLGVGTTTPGMALDVVGDSRTSGTIIGRSGASNSAWGLNVMSGTSYQALLFGNANSNGNAGEVGFNYIGSGSNSNYIGLGFYGGTNKLNLTYGGNVGIGTTTPDVALDVANSSTGVQIRSGNAAGGNTNSSIVFGYLGNNTYRHAIKTRHDSGSSAGNAIDFYLWKYGTDGSSTIGTGLAMTLLGNGYVGIGGITNPPSMLTVTGNATIGSSYRATAAPVNGAIIQGVVGIGTSAPGTAYGLRVAGAAGVGGLLNVSGNITSGGTITGTYSGSGANLTNLSASNVTSGTLGVANGGTGTGTAFTQGSVVFAGASGVYSQNNSGLFWDNTNSSLGIGTATPGSKLSVAGGLSVGNGTFANTAAPTDGVIISGNVGIGTTAPSAALEVHKDGNSNNFQIIKVINTSTGSSAVSGLTITAGSAAAGGQLFHYSNTAATDPNSFAIVNYPNAALRFGVNNGEYMRIAAGGNVGIGKTNPGTALDVNGTVTATGLTSSGTITFSGLTNGILSVNGSGVVSAGTIGVSSGGTGATSFTAGKLLIGNGTSAVTTTTNLHWDTTNGRLGLWATSPGSKLDVQATAVAGSSEIVARFLSKTSNNANDYTGIQIGNSYITTPYIGNDGTGNAWDMAFWSRPGTGFAERMRLKSSGKLGIGTTNPANYLSVSGNASVGVGYMGTNAPTNGLIVQGNVGIGKSNPSSALDVNGGINSTTMYITNNYADSFAVYCTGYAAGNIITATRAGLGDEDRYSFGTQSAWGAVPHAFYIYANKVNGVATNLTVAAMTSSGGLSLGSYAHAGNSPPTGGVIFPGKLGVGTATPSNNLTVSGNASIGASYRNVTAPTNGLIVQGNVGIGTTAPSTGLFVSKTNTNDLATNYNSTAAFSVNGSDVNLVLGGYANGSNAAVIQSRSGGNTSTIGASNYILLLNPLGGNVGIGKSGPSTALDVNGTITATGLTSSGTITFSGLTNGVLSVNGSGVLSAGAIGISAGGTGTSTTFTQGSAVFAGASGVYSQDNSNFFWDNTNKRLGIATSTPLTRMQLGARINDDANWGTNSKFNSDALMVISQYTTGTSILNDPKPVLYLGRQGLSGQAYGALAIFSLSRFQNSGVNSKTRMDIDLADGGFVTANAMTFLSDGRVGLGTTSPATRLDVNGNVTLGNNNLYFGTTNGSGNMRFANTGQGLSWGSDFTRIYDNGDFYITTDDYMYMTIPSRLMITTPKLEIYNGALGFSGTSLNATDKKLYSPADGDLEWFTNNAAGVHGFGISHQGTKAVYLNIAGNSYLNGGNLGVGYTSPITRLQVNNSSGMGRSGGISVSFGSSADYRNYIYPTNNALILDANGDTDVRQAYGAGSRTGSGWIGFYTARGTDFSSGLGYSTEKMRIDTFGNVGIGHTNPSWKLTVKTATNWDGIALKDGSDNTLAYLVKDTGTGSQLALNNGGTATVALYSNGASYFNSGSIGIGTTSPAAKLDVVGDLKVSGNAYARYTSLKTGGTYGSGARWIRIPYDLQNSGGLPLHLFVTRSIFDDSNTPYGGPSLEIKAFGREWHAGQQYMIANYAYHGDTGAEITHAAILDNASGGYFIYLRVQSGVTYKFYTAIDSGKLGAPQDNATGAPSAVDAYALTTGMNITGDTSPNLYVAGKIGIGATAPAAILSIANGASDPVNYGRAIQITNANGNSQQIAFIRNGNNVVSAGYAGSSSIWGFGYGTSTDSSFGPNLLAMDLANSRLGLGTTTPARAFHVAGLSLFGRSALASNYSNSGMIVANGTSAAGGDGGSIATFETADSSSLQMQVMVVGSNTTAAQGINIQSTVPGSTYNPLIFNRYGGNVGIGTSTPLAGTSGSGGATFATSGFEINGSGRTALVVKSNSSLATIVLSPNRSLNDIHLNAKTDGSLELYQYSSNKTILLNAAGNLGIGTTSPSAPLHVKDTGGDNDLPAILIEDTGQWSDYLRFVNSGTGYYISNFIKGDTGMEWQSATNYSGFTLGGGYYSGSDRKLKKDIVTLTPVLDKLLKLNPVTFRLKTEPETATKSIGLIAQEVQPIFPELITSSTRFKDGPVLGVKYGEISVLAVKAIQELATETNALKAENAQLKARLERLEKLLEKR